MTFLKHSVVCRNFILYSCLTTRMLATANRSRVSIRVCKNFARARGMIDPVKIFLTSSLIIVENLVTPALILCTHM